MADGVGIVITNRVMVPRTPAVRVKDANETQGKVGGEGEERRSKNQEVRRHRGTKVGPSSKASREAAASNSTSDGSHPPFGTK